MVGLTAGLMIVNDNLVHGFRLYTQMSIGLLYNYYHGNGHYHN